MFLVEEWLKSIVSKDERHLEERMFKFNKILILCAIYSQVFWVIPNLAIYKIRHWNEGWFTLVPYFKDHPIVGLVISSSNFTLLFLAWLSYGELEISFKEFIKHSKIQELITTIREISGGRFSPYPRFKDFFFSQSLCTFEDRYVQLYTEQRQRVLKLKHLEQEQGKLQQHIQKLEQEQVTVGRQVEEALLLISDDKELTRYENRFREAMGDIPAIRKLIAEIETKARERQGKAERQSAKIEGLVQVLLADVSGHDLCTKAEELLSEARESLYTRRKIDCLKQAISEQRSFNKKMERERAMKVGQEQ